MNPTVEAWLVIEKLASICATPNISSDVQEIANKEIKLLLESVISPGLNKFRASGAGLIVK